MKFVVALSVSYLLSLEEVVVCISGAEIFNGYQTNNVEDDTVNLLPEDKNSALSKLKAITDNILNVTGSLSLDRKHYGKGEICFPAFLLFPQCNQKLFSPRSVKHGHCMVKGKTCSPPITEKQRLNLPVAFRNALQTDISKAFSPVMNTVPNRQLLVTAICKKQLPLYFCQLLSQEDGLRVGIYMTRGKHNKGVRICEREREREREREM